MNDQLYQAFSVGLAAAIPHGDMTVSSWAEQYRIVSEERSARPGKWSNAVLPFLTEIMDVVTRPDVRRVVFMKSSQVGGTEFLNNVLGYYIHMDPSLLMYVAEQELKARAFTEEAFDPMVAATPELRARVYDVGKKSSDNNQTTKRFIGGRLTIGWASSPAQLSSRPVKIIAFDEVDAFETTAEGDAIKLAVARTKTFTGAEKILLNSSPRDREDSIIEPAFMSGDQRQYYVPCLHCWEKQILKWANVRWDDDPLAAYYVCDVCGAMIENDEKEEMLAAGEWRASAEFNGTASFRINELYSPFTTWGGMAADFLESKKNPTQLRVFINTRLGETWEEAGETIEYADLKFNKTEYAAEVPNGVLFLTAGVDIQDDRIELEIIGWGMDKESWSIDYFIIEGSPGLPDVWDRLTDILTREYWGEGDRVYHVAAAAIDSGGHHTQQVYDFCKRNKGRRWFAVKGSSTAGKPIVGKPTLAGKQKVRLFLIGTDTAKDEIFSFLKVEEEGLPGYCHFPDTDKYDDAYFKQLCAEKKITKYRAGQVERKLYVKVAESARNEALDCRVYATAAREILNPKYDVLLKKRAAPVREAVPADEAAEPLPQPATTNHRKRVMTATIPRRRFRVKNNPFG